MLEAFYLESLEQRRHMQDLSSSTKILHEGLAVSPFVSWQLLEEKKLNSYGRMVRLDRII